MNLETREALLFVRGEMAVRLEKLLQRREVVAGELAVMDSEADELQRRIRSVEQDLAA